MTEEILSDLDLYDASDQLPAWFAAAGNALYLRRGLVFPEWLAGG